MNTNSAIIEPVSSIAIVEEYLNQHGHFCLLDWLLAQNFLEYSAYEAWRYGKQDTLDASFTINAETIQKIIANTTQHAQALGLIREPYDYFLWADTDHKPLVASKTLAHHQALTLHWLRAQDAPQLDLFMDNSAVICENEIHAALAGRQFEYAQKKLQQLTTLNTTHAKLGSYQDLVNYGLHMQACMELEGDSLANEMNALEQEVMPLARETLGNNARDYLAFAWRRLAEAAHQLTFNPQQPTLHASYALMQIPDWHAALNSLQKTPRLFTCAPLLQRLAQCHEQLAHHNEALIVWCLLFECDNAVAEKAIDAKLSRPLWVLWQDFWDINDGGMKSFFPAFVFIKNLGLIHHLHKFPALTAPSSKAMVELLAIHINGADEVSAREALQNISPALLRLYLNARVKK